MLLDLTKLLDQPGQVLRFELELDVSDMEFSGQKPVQKPIKAVGAVRNAAGVIKLDAKLDIAMSCICDRCGASYETEKLQNVSAILSEDADDDSDDIFSIVNNCADLDEILLTAFVLDMQTKFLCREDCKGLCFKCGKDLNEGPCGCKKEIDPRLAVLQQLLDD